MTEIRCNSETKEGIVENDNRTTWRVLREEKNGRDLECLRPGDSIELVDLDGNAFATGNVEWVKFTTFGAFTAEDKRHHKSYTSNHECMINLRDCYRGSGVDMGTEIMVIRFSINNFVESNG